MLAEVTTVKILYPEVIQYLKNIGQVEQREIQTVVLPYPVLHGQVDAENEKGLYQEIDKDQEQDVEDKFAVHAAKVNKPRSQVNV